MKFLVVLVLIATMVAVVLSRSDHWGQRQRNDGLVYSKNIVLAPKRGKIHTENISYNPWFNKRNITAIFVNDNFRNNSGAIPVVLKGGVGKTFVNILLSGQRSIGINSTVLVYGKK